MIIIGPEGDFTPEELNEIIEAGAVPVCADICSHVEFVFFTCCPSARNEALVCHDSLVVGFVVAYLMRVLPFFTQN